jgi:hypothetical protein
MKVWLFPICACIKFSDFMECLKPIICSKNEPLLTFLVIRGLTQVLLCHWILGLWKTRTMSSLSGYAQSDKVENTFYCFIWSMQRAQYTGKNMDSQRGLSGPNSPMMRRKHTSPASRGGVLLHTWPVPAPSTQRTLDNYWLVGWATDANREYKSHVLFWEMYRFLVGKEWIRRTEKVSYILKWPS